MKQRPPEKADASETPKWQEGSKESFVWNQGEVELPGWGSGVTRIGKNQG